MLEPMSTALKQRDEELKERRAKVKRWPARLAKLKNRKENPMSERDFCGKYGLAVSQFNRAKNQTVDPRPKKVEAVEAALAAEGV